MSNAITKTAKQSCRARNAEARRESLRRLLKLMASWEVQREKQRRWGIR